MTNVPTCDLMNGAEFSRDTRNGVTANYAVNVLRLIKFQERTHQLRKFWNAAVLVYHLPISLPFSMPMID